MKVQTLAEVAWLALLAAAVVVICTHGRVTTPAAVSGSASAAQPSSQVTDANGQRVPVRNYRRIASGSIVADQLLLALAEPERIALLTAHGRAHSRTPHLYGTRPAFTQLSDVEGLRRAHIELLVLNHLGAPAELERARDAGIQVFNLGEMRGVATLLTNIDQVAQLLGDRARGQTLAHAWQRRFAALAGAIPQPQRKSALYVSAYAGQLFGGTIGTSYHDVLQAAGLVDSAALHYRNWPHYDPEQLLQLDPEVIVAATTSAAQFCGISGLDHLRACAHGAAGVIGVDEALMSDPGLGMLDAAEALRARVYGEP